MSVFIGFQPPKPSKAGESKAVSSESCKVFKTHAECSTLPKPKGRCSWRNNTCDLAQSFVRKIEVDDTLKQSRDILLSVLKDVPHHQDLESLTDEELVHLISENYGSLTLNKVFKAIGEKVGTCLMAGLLMIPASYFLPSASSNANEATEQALAPLNTTSEPTSSKTSPAIISNPVVETAVAANLYPLFYATTSQGGSKYDSTVLVDGHMCTVLRQSGSFKQDVVLDPKPDKALQEFALEKAPELNALFSKANRDIIQKTTFVASNLNFYTFMRSYGVGCNLQDGDTIARWEETATNRGGAASGRGGGIAGMFVPGNSGNNGKSFAFVTLKDRTLYDAMGTYVHEMTHAISYSKPREFKNTLGMVTKEILNKGRATGKKTDAVSLAQQAIRTGKNLESALVASAFENLMVRLEKPETNAEEELLAYTAMLVYDYHMHPLISQRNVAYAKIKALRKISPGIQRLILDIFDIDPKVTEISRKEHERTLKNFAKDVQGFKTDAEKLSYVALQLILGNTGSTFKSFLEGYNQVVSLLTLLGKAFPFILYALKVKRKRKPQTREYTLDDLYFTTQDVLNATTETELTGKVEDMLDVLSATYNSDNTVANSDLTDSDLEEFWGIDDELTKSHELAKQLILDSLEQPAQAGI